MSFQQHLCATACNRIKPYVHAGALSRVRAAPVPDCLTSSSRLSSDRQAPSGLAAPAANAVPYGESEAAGSLIDAICTKYVMTQWHNTNQRRWAGARRKADGSCAYVNGKSNVRGRRYAGEYRTL
jgi:hypothetical protein